ncbi:MAG TPA: nitroreductase/quinone reductase family protein [Trebonia sp.]
MTFEKTAGGTYGQKMPPFVVPLMKVLNPVMLWQARRGTHVAGLHLVVLTTTGAKSGQRRQTVLGALPDGERAWLIVASAGGAAANPAWYHNLAAHPDQAEMQTGRQTYAVHASQLSGAERDAAWQKIVAAGPRYAGYTTKTDRLIPIIRLTAD